jgi:putative redox protein
MGMTKVSARWTGEKLNYVGTDSKGNEIPMGGKDVTPAQMLLLGFAGCTGMDILSILQKKRQHVTDVQVEVCGYMPEDYPKPFQVIELNYIIKGDKIDPKAVARSIELSLSKYCVVGQTLQHHVSIQTSYQIEEE